MNIRKEIRKLSGPERLAFTNTLLALKGNGGYDKYVHWHHAVMVPTVHPDEPQDPDYRNGAHLGPAFLPWHREMLLQLEADLQAITPGITLPYWDWTLDAADPTNSPVWEQSLLGVTVTLPMNSGCRMDPSRTDTAIGRCLPIRKMGCRGRG